MQFSSYLHVARYALSLRLDLRLFVDLLNDGVTDRRETHLIRAFHSRIAGPEHRVAPGAQTRFRNKPERRTKRRLASALCATGLLLLPLLVSVVILTEIGWFVDDAQEKSIIEHLREPQPSDEGDAIVEAVLPGGSTASVR